MASVAPQPIAIIGIGCRLPGGIESPEQLWQLLVDEREVITDVPAERWQLERHFAADPRLPLRQYVRRGGFLEGIDRFDPGLFGITPREALCMDPQQRLLLEVSWRALEDAGQPLDQLRGESVGVFMGLSSADYISLLWASEHDYLFPDNEPFVLAGNTGCIAANRISYAFDFKGPSFTVDTACSSSLVAVHLACESLRRGECRAALAGGAQALLHPGVQMSFCKAGLLAPDGRCKSFDAAADGYVRSEGAGAVLLKPLVDALHDGDVVQGVILGSAVNSDGRSNGLSAPSRRAQIACLRQAYAAAGVVPASALYVEAHGTGTRLGDPVELLALGAVMGQGRHSDRPCRVGSVKSNLGHSETAAGITGLIKATLCLKKRQLPASIHCHRPNPAVDFEGLGLQVQTRLESFPDDLKSAVVGVSSFGFGGTNAHVVLQEAPNWGESKPVAEPPLHLLCLSAHSAAALKSLVASYAVLLRQHPSLRLNDLCACTHLHRGSFGHRLVLVAADRRELLDQLEGRVEPVWHGEVLEEHRNRPLPDNMALVQLGLGGAGGRRKLQDLAVAIGSGCRCNWVHFHAAFPYRRCDLPGHPFLRQRYWWSRADTDQPSGHLWRDHLGLTSASPRLAGQLQAVDLPGTVRHFQMQLSALAPADLGEHLLNQKSVFPAAGYLELAFELLKSSADHVWPLVLSDFQIKAPLPLARSLCELQVVLEGQNACFFSRSAGDQNWASLASLQFGAPKAPAKVFAPLIKVKAEDLASEGQLDALDIDVDAFYRALNDCGLCYGPSYQPIQRLRAHPGEAWAELVRPVGAPDRCLLDGCLQTVAAALSPTLSLEQLFVPVGLAAVELHQWPLPDQLRCRCRLRAGDGTESVVRADLLIQAIDGMLLGQLEDLQLRRINRSAPGLFVTRWRSQGIAAPRPMGAHDQPLCQWLQAQHALTPLVLWPDLEQAGTEQVCLELLEHLRHRPQELWLVLEGDGPASSALDGLLRSAASDLPLCRFTTLHVPRAQEDQPRAAHWPVLQAAAEQYEQLRWSEGELLVPHLEPLPPRRFRVASNGSGRLEGLQAVALPPRALAEGELELAVEATGLNFRDVLNALGLLAEQMAARGLGDPTQLPFGGECVGRVTAVGPGVDPGLIGQQLIAALAVGSLASHVVARAALCAPLPEGLSVADGAAVSTAFLTAIYGLEHLAQLQAGETVLIHAAAGGVGQAALQIALRCGARVFATASQSKQQALLQQGVEAVFDSRSLEFADQLLSHTEGRGVDVVLNSFKGEWVDASFRCLAEGGRFVELGKIEVWSGKQAQERRPDARYLPFDLLEVAETHPLQVGELFQRLMADLNRGVLRPLPTTVLPLDSLEAAFRLMAQAKHVGKVVLTQPQPYQIRPDATYVVSGALGGIGRQLVPWLVQRGARSLLLLARSLDGMDRRAQDLLAELRQAGVQCRMVACALGIGQSEALVAALQTLPKELPVRGVFHAAGVLRDGSLMELEAAQLGAVLQPKLMGWLELEQACQQVAPNTFDFVVGFSSVAALLGSPGQAAYSAANGAMEGLCGSQSPRRLAIQWGPWAGEGMAAGMERRFHSQGIGALAPNAALSLLGELLDRGQGGVVAALDNDWQRLRNQASPRQRHWFAALVDESLGHGAKTQAQLLEQLKQQLHPLGHEQRHQHLISLLASRLARLMDDEAPAQLDTTQSLFDLGLDSLMAVEFTALVQSELGLELDLHGFSEDPSLERLAHLGLDQLFSSDDQDDARLDLAAEAELPAGWVRPQLPPARCPGAAIFLTGATGYLGAYLLAGQLQRWPELRVRCLVRASSEQAGLARIESNLQHYGLWQGAWAPRLEVVLGDLAEERFGLDPDRFRSIACGLGGILHNGAQLSQMATYAQLAAANVGGTRAVLELATAAESLRLELISSVAVFEATAYRNRELLESDPLEEWQGIPLGYSQTKWVSEQLVLAAGRAGLPVVVYRPPLIGGHSRTGQWHDGDLLQRLLQGALALGLAPDLAWELDTVPVDYVADAVSALAWSEPAKGRCFHLQHPQPMLLAELVKRLGAEGAPLQLVPMAEWLAAIQGQPCNPLYPLRAFFEQRWGPDQLTYPELNSVGFRARPSSASTISMLAQFGVRCTSFEDLVGPWARALLGSSGSDAESSS